MFRQASSIFKDTPTIVASPSSSRLFPQCPLQTSWMLKKKSLLKTFTFDDTLQAHTFLQRAIPAAKHFNSNPESHVDDNKVVVKLTPALETADIGQNEFDLGYEMENQSSIVKFKFLARK